MKYPDDALSVRKHVHSSPLSFCARTFMVVNNRAKGMGDNEKIFIVGFEGRDLGSFSRIVKGVIDVVDVVDVVELRDMW